MKHPRVAPGEAMGAADAGPIDLTEEDDIALDPDNDRKLCLLVDANARLVAKHADGVERLGITRQQLSGRMVAAAALVPNFELNHIKLGLFLKNVGVKDHEGRRRIVTSAHRTPTTRYVVEDGRRLIKLQKWRTGMRAGFGRRR